MNNWIAVDTSLPETFNPPGLDWLNEQASNPVLAFDGLTIFVAFFVRGIDPDDEYSHWATDCSERWNLMDSVTHWQALPTTPKGKIYTNDLL